MADMTKRKAEDGKGAAYSSPNPGDKKQSRTAALVEKTEVSDGKQDREIPMQNLLRKFEQ